MTLSSIVLCSERLSSLKIIGRLCLLVHSPCTALEFLDQVNQNLTLSFSTTVSREDILVRKVRFPQVLETHLHYERETTGSPNSCF